MIRDKFSRYAFLILAVAYYFSFFPLINFNFVRMDKSNGGYCFVDFSSPSMPATALTLNSTPIPGSSRPFKLN